MTIKFIRRSSIYWTLVVIALAWAAVQPFNEVKAASIKLNPLLSVRYSMNDNVDSVDTSEIDDQTTTTYMNYILGMELTYAEGRQEVGINGTASYQQYLTMEGLIEETGDTSPEDYNFFNLGATAFYNYRNRGVNFGLAHTITQNRDLQEIFNVGTDSLNYRYLYTNNVTDVSLRLSPGSRSRFYIGYSYASLVFAEPENEAFDNSKPPDSLEHRGKARAEYDFTGKTTGIVDLQAANRTFEDIENDINADYNLYQGMGGLRYQLSSRIVITGMGGMAYRYFLDLSDQTLRSPPYPPNSLAYELEDMADPIGILALSYNSPNGMDLSLKGEQGISTYGKNLFYTHTSAYLGLTYPFNPRTGLGIDARYQRAVFDVEQNGREWQWEEDRIDDLILGNARLYYNLLMKEGRPTMSMEVGYSYRSRESSLDEPQDYTPEYQSISFFDEGVRSYDSIVQVYYVQVTFRPTIRLAD